MFRRVSCHSCCLLALLATPLCGCFAERSIRYSTDLLPRPARNDALVLPAQVTPVAPATYRPDAGTTPSSAAQPDSALPPVAVLSSPARDTRAWLRTTHARLSQYLPKGQKPALLTDDLVAPNGRARDVNAYFKVNPARLHTLLGNFDGLIHSAQASGTKYAIEAPAPPWDGFEDIWIPIDYAGIELSGRLGLARDERGVPRKADCIVILPGIFGDNSVERTRQIATALRAAGLHALALEQRGCGQTEKRFPELGITWGMFEAGDLLAVSEWLEQQPHVRRTGLVAFCWGSNVALITAWEDGRAEDDPLVAPALRQRLRPRTTRRHFEAGVLAFSPCLPFENICDAADSEWSLLENPVLNKLQKETRARCERRGYTIPPHNLRGMIEEERKRSPAGYLHGAEDGYQYLRLHPYKDKPSGDKFEAMRMPVLIVHGCNDPLSDAQPVADVIAQTENRNVAAVVLPGGGHVGFAPYASNYFYGLLFSFFDPQSGAAAMRGTGTRPIALQ